MAIRTLLSSLISLVALTVVGYVGIFIDASLGGYVADLMGRPTAGVSPRFPWELQFVIVVISFTAVLLLRQVLGGLFGLGRLVAALVSAVLLTVSYVIGATVTGGEALVGNVLLRSYIGGSQSQMVLLAVAALLVTALASIQQTPGSRAAPTKTSVSSPE
ncbi:hypothetical protein [Pseudarthrobacter niigatensis]|uniref:Uncharacterized protein n=1 Tax=Pseudarthrobacter niigatensis TaxID=369935 RepID=A0AAJ1SVN1_9MICC|nr:hypothetical protein [Pseudarthrobacter niigatensis]MDQ0144602.1 hypothetical protein [Pseudarthrobacter niigatensis]MDQ0265248.1 hypothetical protein [Pseudarthrobacter niigatensis]